MPSAEEIKKIVESYVDLVANGTPEQVADLYAADATVEDPIGADIRNTRESLIEFYGVIAAMDKVTSELHWSKIAGDTAVFEFTLITEAGGSAFKITPVDIMVFDNDGKIKTMRAVWSAEDLQTL
ncbi:steroid delta-isomerase [Williamsia sp. 1138]|uniref:nuclear transport factor 2 family protein n=1 Tax=Williamsia sp. 1138 TaxID=1903117 RepID=UPI000A10F361|nr:nuclear transport factor 2 family protein [Williamsia sp. 1138]OZG27473.1 steroid delta-isomerase [Williamsia sp. 1138]